MQHVVIVVLLSALAVVKGDNTTCEWDGEQGPWSSLLQQWAVDGGARRGRILAPPGATYYITDRVGPRPYDEWAPPPPPPPGKILNKPPNPYKDQFKPSYEYPAQQSPSSNHPPPSPWPPQGPAHPPHQPYPASHPPQHQVAPQHGQSYPGQPHPAQQYPSQSSPPPPRPPPPSHHNAVDRVDAAPQRKEVSETDLYLLGAIEKLVYRVDLMEKRLRKVEETMHYLVVGKDKIPEPCVTNFSRVASRCYHFSGAPADWKAANLACRRLRGSLLELADEEHRRALLAALQLDNNLKDMDWWSGGLNPGLLWIWAGSARPVLSNATTTASNSTSIPGEGRCLALVYDAATRRHVYRGQDCALRHRYICEKDEDKMKLSNEIERVARQLRRDGGRQARLWTGDLLPTETQLDDHNYGV